MVGQYNLRSAGNGRRTDQRCPENLRESPRYESITTYLYDGKTTDNEKETKIGTR